MCQWFSGKIQRCHRWAPSSILGWRKIYVLDRVTLLSDRYHFLLLLLLRDLELCATSSCQSTCCFTIKPYLMYLFSSLTPHDIILLFHPPSSSPLPMEHGILICCQCCYQRATYYDYDSWVGVTWCSILQILPSCPPAPNTGKCCV